MMANVFEVKLTKDRLTAVLDLTDRNKLDSVTMDSLSDLLRDNKITYGVKLEVLESIARNPFSVTFPIAIAQGKPAVSGTDSYLRNEIKLIKSGEIGRAHV